MNTNSIAQYLHEDSLHTAALATTINSHIARHISYQNIKLLKMFANWLAMATADYAASKVDTLFVRVCACITCILTTLQTQYFSSLAFFSFENNL